MASPQRKSSRQITHSPLSSVSTSSTTSVHHSPAHCGLHAPNTHRRRDSTRQLRRVGRVYWALSALLRAWYWYSLINACKLAPRHVASTKQTRQKHAFYSCRLMWCSACLKLYQGLHFSTNFYEISCCFRHVSRVFLGQILGTTTENHTTAESFDDMGHFLSEFSWIFFALSLVSAYQSSYNGRIMFTCLSVCHPPLAPSVVHGRGP